jgi:hypothetical protein
VSSVRKPTGGHAGLMAYIDRYAWGGVEGRIAAMREWHGFTDESSAPACPRVVAGKRCKYVNCLCQYGGGISNLLDHRGIWLDKNRRHVFTAEPYTSSLDLELLEGFRAEAAHLGLTVRLSARSPWFPTYTTMIIVERAD